MNFMSAVGNLMTELGAQNQSSQPDFPISLIIDDRWELVVDRDADKQEIIISVPVRAVGINVLNNAEAARRILQFSLLGAQTNGCALSFSADTKSLVVWLRRFDEFQDEQSVQAVMDRVVSTAVFIDGWCREKLNECQNIPEKDVPVQNNEEKNDWLKI